MLLPLFIFLVIHTLRSIPCPPHSCHFSLSPLFYAPFPLPPHHQIFLAPPRTVASSAIDAVSTSTSASALKFPPKVIITRERGKNAKLIVALVCASIHSLHISHLWFVFLQLHCNVLNLRHRNSNQLVVSFFSKSHSRSFATFSCNLNLFFLVFIFSPIPSMYITCFWELNVISSCRCLIKG